jgi:hypothetical protein
MVQAQDHFSPGEERVVLEVIHEDRLRLATLRSRINKSAMFFLQLNYKHIDRDVALLQTIEMDLPTRFNAF